MSNHEVLKQYSRSIKILKKECEDAGMSDEEFRVLYQEALSTANLSQNSRYKTKRRVIWILVLAAVCTLYNFRFIYSNLQECIYPGLKLLRRLSIPIISVFTSLTEWYYETCLLQNPFFTILDMDCWPCSGVNNVQRLYEVKPILDQYCPPFFYETDQPPVSLETLKETKLNNVNIFDLESRKVLINNKYYVQTQTIFDRLKSNSGNEFYIWKFNTMDAARLIRQIIPRPKVVPRFGQSPERFIIVDSSSSQRSYEIPDTECNFSFLLSLRGRRMIKLKPSKECEHRCKVLEVELKDSYLLWYNWWYWRPIVQPHNSTFIAHVGSYC